MKINLLILSLFTFSLSNAQIKKGNLFIGGDVYLGISNANNSNAGNGISKSSSVGILPSIGWVTKDNLVVGATIITNFYTSNYTNSENYNKSNRIGAGIWVRKYLPIGKSFYLYGNGMLSGLSVYNKSSTYPQLGFYKEKGYSININVLPGIAYQVNKCLFLEAALNNLIGISYERKNTEYQNTGSVNNKGVTNSFNLSSSIGNGTPLQVGMRWMIARK